MRKLGVLDSLSAFALVFALCACGRADAGKGTPAADASVDAGYSSRADAGSLGGRDGGPMSVAADGGVTRDADSSVSADAGSEAALGCGSTNHVSGTLYDFYDDIAVARVDYSNWTEGAFPLARITSPSWGLTYTAGKAISLQGHADDPEDGAVPSDALSWSSETDGPLGTGSTVNVSTLTPGLQRIWLSATDSAGQVGKVYVELQVEAP